MFTYVLHVLLGMYFDSHEVTPFGAYGEHRIDKDDKKVR